MPVLLPVVMCNLYCEQESNPIGEKKVTKNKNEDLISSSNKDRGQSEYLTTVYQGGGLVYCLLGISIDF